jgi:hypothetical protein
MNLIHDDVCKKIEDLAKTYPNDQGVRMITDLARWVEEQCQLCAAAEMTLPDSAA